VDRSYLANTILALLITATTAALWSVGEHRVDAYFSLYVLEYAVIKAVLRPRRSGRDWLFVALITAFFACVAYRIAKVLSG